jgi:hypothetical protein
MISTLFRESGFGQFDEAEKCRITFRSKIDVASIYPEKNVMENETAFSQQLRQSQWFPQINQLADFRFVNLAINAHIGYQWRTVLCFVANPYSPGCVSFFSEARR